MKRPIRWMTIGVNSLLPRLKFGIPLAHESTSTFLLSAKSANIRANPRSNCCGRNCRLTARAPRCHGRSIGVARIWAQHLVRGFGGCQRIHADLFGAPERRNRARLADIHPLEPTKTGIGSDDFTHSNHERPNPPWFRLARRWMTRGQRARLGVIASRVACSAVVSSMRTLLPLGFADATASSLHAQPRPAFPNKLAP
jgi:hypothetical protein